MLVETQDDLLSRNKVLSEIGTTTIILPPEV